MPSAPVLVDVLTCSDAAGACLSIPHHRLNAIPIVKEYTRDPDNMYLLRVGVAGLMNCLPNIDAHGAISMGFHLHPSAMQFDNYSGDWGVGFFGSARHLGGFLVAAFDQRGREAFGVYDTTCFMCDVATAEGVSNASTSTAGRSFKVTPRDPWRKKLFVAALGLQLSSEAGTVQQFVVSQNQITVVFDAVHDQPKLRLRVAQPAVVSGNRPELAVAASVGSVVRGAYELQPAKSGPTKLVLSFK